LAHLPHKQVSIAMKHKLQNRSREELVEELETMTENELIMMVLFLWEDLELKAAQASELTRQRNGYREEVGWLQDHIDFLMGMEG